MKNKIALLGIVDVCIYTVTVLLYLIVKSEPLLTIWEVVTFLSAPVMLLILLDILKNYGQVNPIYQILAVVFMTCNIALTSLAHFVNITVTRNLIAEGINIPTYLQIGYWPSVEMAIDYLAWGFFMGLAFLMTAFALLREGGVLKRLKITLLVCGILCLTGFFGAVVINENLWYLAPMGYGAGTIVLCIETLLDSKNTKLA